MFKDSEFIFLLFLSEHVCLLDHGIDRSVQLPKARYVFSGFGGNWIDGDELNQRGCSIMLV